MGMKYVALLMPVFACSVLQAQQPPATLVPPLVATPPPAGAKESTGTTTPSAGQGRPPIIIPASTDQAVVRLQLTLTTRPRPGDLEIGLLASEQNPNQRIIPTVELQPSAAGNDSPGDVVLKISGLVPFGDSTAPLLHQGRQVETLRFHKAGLLVRPGADGPIVAREQDGMLLLVLENPSGFEYRSVKARVRFQGVDVCAVSADRSGGTAPKAGGDCLDGAQWTTFDVPRFSHVSLRADTLPHWFRDPDTRRARGDTRNGVLTLRYQGDQPSAVFEQNLPLAVRFDPGDWSLTWSIGRVAIWLIVGALVSLLLRVSIPNYRRKSALKEQLNEARKATADISDQVNSQLRVLLRVERLALEQRRREGWVLGPDFDETAARVDAGLATLTRKIGFVQRLDATACRREALLEGLVSPTRTDVIDRNLAAACEALKSDQLSDADWLFVQQRLEAADKALSEPSQDERQAFEALLSQRWRSIKDHFGLVAGSNELVVPSSLKGMEDCFPDGSLLPKLGDDDGTKWIASIGAVRADLQLAALEIVRDVQFLAPVLNVSQKWTDAITLLTGWLTTPATVNLGTARRQLLELAEGVSQEDIVRSLQNGEAQIELDPQCVNPNQTVRMTVRFRDPRLNDAIARAGVECEWCFHEPRMAKLLKWRTMPAAQAAQPNQPAPAQPQAQTECGWRVHRYFEPGILTQPVEARFFWKGQPVKDASGSEVKYSTVVAPQERSRHHRKDQLEKWLWRPAPQALQLFAALLVPLAALAVTTAGEAASGQWWDLVGLGFGSETIRNILTGQQTPPAT